VILITQKYNEHKPVLLEQVLATLQPKEGESYLDLTVGYGGHAREVLKRTNAPQKAILVDRDLNALKSIEDLQDMGATPMHSDFATAVEVLKSEGKKFNLILADFGVSSPHLDNSERGFSFMREGPLDMRMDQTQGTSAADLVNNLSGEELVKLLREYGEEPQAKRIVTAIIEARPIKTTTQLADVIEAKLHRRGKTHPATRTFQALRIAVNQELDQVKTMLRSIEDLLEVDGRLAIISFHSLEDRLVKNFFKEKANSGYESTFRLLTKKPILGETEAVNNPRSRSAVLRAGVKINT
jgi:16S rRNA (cytosine1402-N4)-methyltransferase